MDHQKRVRVFFQSLKSKSRTHEFVGPIRNLDGELSNSHSECLKFWSIYCEKLYSKTCNKNLFDCISIENMDLDSPINYDEFISSLKSLKNNKAPGSDFITNEDFKNLLSLDDSEIKESVVILQSVYNVIRGFREKESVPKS